MTVMTGGPSSVSMGHGGSGSPHSAQVARSVIAPAQPWCRISRGGPESSGRCLSPEVSRLINTGQVEPAGVSVYSSAISRRSVARAPG